MEAEFARKIRTKKNNLKLNQKFMRNIFFYEIKEETIHQMTIYSKQSVNE